MLEEFSPEARKVLWEYPFIRDYVNGKITDKIFLDNLRNYRNEFISKKVPLQEITWLEHLPKDRVKDVARDRRAKLICLALTEIIKKEFPEILEDYEINFERLDYHEQLKNYESIDEYEKNRSVKQETIQREYHKYDHFPIYKIILKPRSASNHFLIMQLLREDIDRKVSKINFYSEYQIPSFAGSILKFIDENDKKYGMSKYKEINMLFYEHVYNIKELGILPKIWYWYDDLKHIGMVKSDSHTHFFNSMINVYVGGLKDPTIHPKLMLLILELYLKLFKITQVKMPQTIFQKREAKMLYEGFLKKVWDLVGIEGQSWISSKIQEIK